MNKLNKYKLNKYTKNNINYLIKLKNEIKINKISHTSNIYCEYEYFCLNDLDFNGTHTKIIIKRYKYFKEFKFAPAMLNKNKIKYSINNLAIDHLTLDFYFYYFDEYYGITLPMQLTMLIYLLKNLKIKKITLKFSIINRYFSGYDLFCKSLKNIFKEYCKDMYVYIYCDNALRCFIKHLEGNSLCNEESCPEEHYLPKDNKYVAINKFRTNYHRNYQLKNRIA